jgi:hypothetical protein
MFICLKHGILHTHTRAYICTNAHVQYIYIYIYIYVYIVYIFVYIYAYRQSFLRPFPCTLLKLRPLVFSLTPFGWLLFIKLTTAYSIITYGNAICDLHLFD